MFVSAVAFHCYCMHLSKFLFFRITRCIDDNIMISYEIYCYHVFVCYFFSSSLITLFLCIKRDNIAILMIRTHLAFYFVITKWLEYIIVIRALRIRNQIQQYSNRIRILNPDHCCWKSALWVHSCIEYTVIVDDAIIIEPSFLMFFRVRCENETVWFV